MTDRPEPGRKSGVWVLIAYALICALALGFDLSTDRSFGALMLAVLPISLLALACLVVGPWLEGARRSAASRAWSVGALLILVVSIAFSLLGADQAKTGVLIFTYAAMIMALPSSLVLPFVASWLGPMLGDSVIAYIPVAWIVCVAAGWLEWKALGWLYAKVRRRMRG